jgi:ankyrin repeat protein
MDAADDWFRAEELHFAAQDGDLPAVQRLLDDGRDVNAFDGLAKAPLHYAVESERFEVAEYLIAHGADVNAHDDSRIGNTPLREVAATCSLRMATLLIDAGADPTIPGWMQLTAIHKAEARRDEAGRDVLQLLLRAARNHG